MKKNTKFITIISLILISVLIQTTICYADSPSSWAKSDVEEAILMSLVPQIMVDNPYTESVTRAEFCHLATNLYKKITNNEIPFGIEGFADTFDITICGAAELGIINGYADGYFYPDNPITRQEIAAVLCRTLKLCGVDISAISNEVIHKLSSFRDKNDLASWASDSVAFCMTKNIINGTSETELNPLGFATREQAIVMANRCIKNIFSASASFAEQSINPYDSLSCDVSGGVDFVSFSNRALTINWQIDENAVLYRIGLYLSSDNFWYTNEDTFVKIYETTSPSVTLKNLRAGKEYNIIIDAVDISGSVVKSIYATAYPHELYTLQEKEQIIFADGEINSKEFADSQMQNVTVKIWAINKSGNKYSSTMSLTVHKSIAELVKMVFDEIYNGEEKFPFKDVGAYSWRAPMSSGSYSHHNYGTAIDLNYNENYCLYKNGTFVGKHWKPYEDVYSFPPDGEVISIFAKYGFAWGGDEWSNPKDYMHFSYLEL